MLSILAYAMIAAFMALIMTKRMSVLAALVIVPIVFALLGGFGLSELAPMMLAGVKSLAPTGAMLLFGILYFSLMIDVGLFDPAVAWVVKLVGGDPLKICVGTAVLALFVSLDGDGSTTYLITTAAMLPLYKRLGMSRLMLASIIIQAGGVMNILPWGGPTARAAAALGVDAGELFVPLIPAMVGGAICVICVAFLFGRRERQRLGITDPSALQDLHAGIQQRDEQERLIRRPRLFWFNLALTLALLAAMMLGLMPLMLLFLIACAIALSVNYPRIEDQRARIAANAGNVLAVVSVVFAAGVFTGILSGTKMIDAMAHSVVAAVPPELGPCLGLVTGLLSMPFTFFISNDAFYYGIVPVLAHAAAAYDITTAEIGRASLIGQPVHLLSPLVPSTYLLCGLCGIELGDHQRFTIKWSVLSSLVILAVGMATAVIPLFGRL